MIIWKLHLDMYAHLASSLSPATAHDGGYYLTCWFTKTVFKRIGKFLEDGMGVGVVSYLGKDYSVALSSGLEISQDTGSRKWGFMLIPL